MRKMMTKEVTTTTVKVAKMEMENGLPVAVNLPDEILLGNVTLDKAQRILNKKFGQPVTVFEVSANTNTYEMPVEEFVKVATLKVDDQQETAE
jgi:hypothetical protein